MNKNKKWILCPVCGSKTKLQIRADTELKNFLVYRPRCRQESLIDAKDLQHKKMGDENMNLIISVLKKDDLYNKKIIENIQKKINDVEVIYTEDMNIKGCIGCNRCWLVTPGVCTIKDDYEKLLIKFLQSKQVIFITDLKLGFVSYKLKNIFDRFLPLLTMNLRFKNGQMRHYLRYKKHYKMGLIYKGNGNQEFLEKWLERVMINLDGTSTGAYNIENEEEILNALIND